LLVREYISIEKPTMVISSIVLLGAEHQVLLETLTIDFSSDLPKQDLCCIYIHKKNPTQYKHLP
jgi:hypothetical protein